MLCIHGHFKKSVIWKQGSSLNYDEALQLAEIEGAGVIARLTRIQCKSHLALRQHNCRPRTCLPDTLRSGCHHANPVDAHICSVIYSSWKNDCHGSQVFTHSNPFQMSLLTHNAFSAKCPGTVTPGPKAPVQDLTRDRRATI